MDGRRVSDEDNAVGFDGSEESQPATGKLFFSSAVKRKKEKKRVRVCTWAANEQKWMLNNEKHANLFTEERCSSTGPLKVRKDMRSGRKRPPLVTTPFFT